jgi:hypothetical protein
VGALAGSDLCGVGGCIVGEKDGRSRGDRLVFLPGPDRLVSVDLVFFFCIVYFIALMLTAYNKATTDMDMDPSAR